MLRRLQTLGFLGLFFKYCPRSVTAFGPAATTASSSSSRLDMAAQNDSSTLDRIRVLALHGSESDGKTMEMVVGEFKENAFFAHGLELEITAIDAPKEKGKGYAWWLMPPSVRSFNAKEYEGFDDSADKVIETVKAADPPFDLVIGHSQGAILTTALLALERFPSHPRLGYILNGVAWPNPYTNELESLSLPGACRVLIVTGEADKINAPAQQERVQKTLDNAGCDVSVIRHGGGHSVPTQNGDAVEKIMEWVVQGVSVVQT